MEIRNGKLAGLKIIQLKIRRDERGFFVERYHAAQFAAKGFPEFVQDNHSLSQPRILRGLHYQSNPAQGKLVGVTRGRVWDVAVDIRPNSPTFGQHEAIELTGENGLLFWIPAGFAHGFCVLGDEPADMLYKVNSHWNGPGEGGIRFDDKDLDIPWPLKNPQVSDRDRELQNWKDYCKNPPKWEAV